MSELIRLSLTTVNAPDAIALARFYAEITGGVAKGDEYWALVEGPNGDIGFQQIDDYRPPTWPDGEVGMQMHLEFFVDDLEATGARVAADQRSAFVGRGAKLQRASTEPSGCQAAFKLPAVSSPAHSARPADACRGRAPDTRWRRQPATRPSSNSP